MIGYDGYINKMYSKIVIRQYVLLKAVCQSHIEREILNRNHCTLYQNFAWMICNWCWALVKAFTGVNHKKICCVSSVVSVGLWPLKSQIPNKCLFFLLVPSPWKISWRLNLFSPHVFNICIFVKPLLHTVLRSSAFGDAKSFRVLHTGICIYTIELLLICTCWLYAPIWGNYHSWTENMAECVLYGHVQKALVSNESTHLMCYRIFPVLQGLKVHSLQSFDSGCTFLLCCSAWSSSFYRNK